MRRKRNRQESQQITDSDEVRVIDEGPNSMAQSCNLVSSSQGQKADKSSIQTPVGITRQPKSSRITTQSSQISQMSSKTRDDLTARLVRYLLYKANRKQAIRFDDISKDVYPQYRNISRYFFEKACTQLENIFGYHTVQIEDASREHFLIINAITDQAHLSNIYQARQCAGRGFLILILGLLCCADNKQLEEDELWAQLKSADDKVERNQDHPVLGDLSTMLKRFENELYLRSKTQVNSELKKIRVYMCGSRAELEIGKEAILDFVCKNGEKREKDKYMELIASSYDSDFDDEYQCDDDCESERHKAKEGEIVWTRRFPHVVGNWPSYVYISIVENGSKQSQGKEFSALADEIIDDVRVIADKTRVHLVASSNSAEDNLHHLSLSRPFVLTYNMIEKFVQELRLCLKWRRTFVYTLQGLRIFINEDATRSFLAINMIHGTAQYLHILRCVNSCMMHFQLPPYYENPKPHVSVASSPHGTLGSILTQAQLERLPSAGLKWHGIATHVVVAIGNRRFKISLN